MFIVLFGALPTLFFEYAVLLFFYGVYFGVLSRDLVERLSERSGYSKGLRFRSNWMFEGQSFFGNCCCCWSLELLWHLHASFLNGLALQLYSAKKWIANFASFEPHLISYALINILIFRIPPLLTLAS